MNIYFIDFQYKSQTMNYLWKYQKPDSQFGKFTAQICRILIANELIL